MKDYFWDVKFENVDKDDLFIPNVGKVGRLFWANVDEVKHHALLSPDRYTKTFLMWLKEAMLIEDTTTTW